MRGSDESMTLRVGWISGRAGCTIPLTLISHPLWNYADEGQCPLYGWKHCNIKHILVFCNFSLNNKSFNWRHDYVLRLIAVALLNNTLEMKRKSGQASRFRSSTSAPVGNQTWRLEVKDPSWRQETERWSGMRTSFLWNSCSTDTAWQKDRILSCNRTKGRKWY